MSIRLGAILLLTAFVTASPVQAQSLRQREILNKLDFEQHIGAQVPRSAAFKNEAGESVTLGSLMGEKPVLLNLVYYECPMLCTMVLNGVLTALRAVSLTANKDFDIITISIDPRESPELARKKKKHYLSKYNREGADGGWHFLTGSQESIDAIADAVGFSYVFNEETEQYAHAAGTVFLTPDAIVSRYLFGIEYAPRDLRLALVEASKKKIGNPVDKLLLYCYQYDAATGKYGLLIMNVLRVAGLGTVMLLVGALFLMLRRERRLHVVNRSSSSAAMQKEV
jgi:protein SCO1/2